MTDRRDMEAVIEAILFVAHDPVSPAKLLEVFSEREREAAGEALEQVIERYRGQPGEGVVIDDVAGGLRLVTRPDLHGYLRRFFEVTSRNKLSMPALETLAIIAYRQPITGPEIQELRNVSSSGVVKKLLERRLVRIAGRKEVVGKPFLYSTTREFLMHFGLKSLKELPPLEQFEELFGDEFEAAPENLEPDPEELIDQEAAAVAESDDEAAEEKETREIEEERVAAEEAEESPVEEPPPPDLAASSEGDEDSSPADPEPVVSEVEA